MKKDFFESIICFDTATVGERGQIVVPAEIRKKLKIKSGDKLVAFLTPAETIILIPSNQFGKIVSVFHKKLDKLTELIK